MSNTEQHLKRIQDKLQQLLKEHAQLLKENSRMKDELASAKEKISLQQKNMDELKQQVSILKVSSGEAGRMNEADKKEFEKRINSYLREIDRCIALLGE
ncbi:MAG: hypothetical protein U0U70_14695 [Chitinophagaceae bacterium]